MNLSRRREKWDALAKRDPLWAILASPDKAGNRWDLAEFFQTGVEEIDQALAMVAKLPVKPSHIRALDFGCGVGRLSQALACRFDNVDGIDISPRMIELANKLNRFENTCHYHVNAADDLGFFDANSFDFVYSRLVLMHIPPKISRGYLREFLRVLQPGGVLLFQLPEGPVSPILRAMPQSLLDWTFNATRNAYRRLFRIRPVGWEMHWMTEAKVRRVLHEAGGKILEIVDDEPVEGKLATKEYFVTK